MFDELDRAVQAGDADKAGRVFGDLKSRFPGTAFTDHGALAAAQVQFDKGAMDAAKASLTWLADNGADDDLRTVARLRLAGILLQAKQYAEAIQQLDATKSADFVALVADRRGDVLSAQGKNEEAKAAFQVAYKAMDERTEYRRLIDAKLTALGAAPAGSAASAASGVAQ